VAVGLFKKVLGKEKPEEAEAVTAEEVDLEEPPGESAEAAASGTAETSGNGHEPEGSDLPEWKVEAGELSDKGQASLDAGDAGEAVLHLLEALRIYEAHEDEPNAIEISEYLGAALYDLGRQNEAVSVWEEIISRGCEERPVYERLIDHYEESDRSDDVARVRLLLESIS
jgi:tetratricopeptide (TPR) repeat protein